MNGELIVSIIALCLAGVQAIGLVIIKIFKTLRKTTDEKEKTFKNNLRYIWNNNYSYYYRELYMYYKKQGKFDNFDNLSNIPLKRQKFLISVDDICLKEITNVKDLNLLEDVKVSVEYFDNYQPLIKIDTSKLPNKKKTFLQNYMNVCELDLRNSNSYFLKAVNKDDGIKYIVHGAGYNNYIESGLYLEYDLSNYELDDIRRGVHMRLRDQLNLLNFNNRYVGIGVCTLTILKNVYNKKTKNNTDTYFLIHNRGSNLTEHPSQKSVIPAGTFEPNGDNYSDERSLRFSNTVYREFIEELFNDEDFNLLGTNELIENNEQIENLKVASNLYYLGSGIDIINGKLEVLSVLVIDVSKWDKEYRCMDSNDLNQSFQANFEGNITIREFRYDRLKQYATDSNFVPCAREIFSILCYLKEQGVRF